MSKKIYILITAVVLLFVSMAVFYFILNKSFLDASIKTDTIVISPRISGKIIELNINEDSTVKKGEIIAKIDSSDLENELKIQKENLEKMKNMAKVSKDEFERINLQLEKLQDEVKIAYQKLESANNDYVLYKNAYKDGSVTKKDLSNATKNLEVARAGYKKAKENLKSASKNSENNNAKKNNQDKELSRQLARIEGLEAGLLSASVVSPLNGSVLSLNAKAGDFIKKDATLVSVVSNDVYIIAKPDKNKAPNPKKRQKVIVRVKNKNLNGVIDEINDNGIKILFSEDISKYDITSKTKAKVKIPTQ